MSMPRRDVSGGLFWWFADIVAWINWWDLIKIVFIFLALFGAFFGVGEFVENPTRLGG